METETEEKADNYREYPICRTCLNVIRSRSYRLQENSGFGDALKISHILRYIVPELVSYFVNCFSFIKLEFKASVMI